MKMMHSINPTAGLVLALTVLLASASASGAARTWTGNSGVSGNWNYTANWLGGLTPQNGDDIVFPAGASRLYNTNVYSRSFGSITFEGNGYRISGNVIPLSGGIESQTAGASNRIYTDVQLTASQQFDSDTGTYLYVYGNVDLGSHTLTTRGYGLVSLVGVVSGTGGITKNGGGTHYLAGSSQNTYTGPTRVLSGTLDLSKTGGHAVKYGSLTIGNNSGDADTVVVRQSYNYQIGDSVPVKVYCDGWLDLGNYSDTVGAITLSGGHAGSSASGSLRISSGGVSVVDNPTRQARMDGEVYMTSVRPFDIADTPFFPDLRVDAVLAGAGGFTKTGSGSMGLYGDGTFSGAATVEDGLVYLYHNNALGAVSGGTTVESGAALVLHSGTDVGAEPLELNGNGVSTLGALSSIYGDSSWAGDITLDSDCTINVLQATDELELSGTISGSGGFTKTLDGDLILSGSANNTYSGATMVDDGQLLMDKNSPRWAIGYGSLTVGDGSGAEQSTIAKALGNYQLGSIPVTVNSDGLLDLNNYNDTIGNSLALNGGGDVKTGTGTLSLGANSQVSVEGLWPPTHINGNLNVGSGECIFDVGNLFYIDASMSGSANITKTGSDFMYLMSSNSFTGTLTVDESYLTLGDPWALGSEAAGTYVNNAARLGVPTQVGNESLTMNSSYPSGAIISSGFYAPPGSNSWAGPVTLLQDTTVGVSSGYVFNVSGQISGTGGLEKQRGGTLRIEGSVNNTYAGTTYVQEGMLQMNNSGSGIGAIPHDLVIGGNNPGDPAAVAQHLGTVEVGGDVTVNASGFYDLNNYHEAITDLNLNGGADVDSGTGLLSIGGDINVDPLSYTNVSSTISGKLRILGTCTLTVPQGAMQGSNPSDLIIDAVISGGGNLSKTGSGELQLMGANTFTGPFSINDGGLRLDNNLGLGSTSGGTTVNGDAYLQIHGSGHHILGEHLTLNSTYRNWGTLYSTSGSNSWSGNITLQSDAAIGIGTSAGNVLNLSGSIGGSGSLRKVNVGTLIMSGASGNTYTSPTYVDRGTLLLEKTVANETIIGRLYIGDGLGGVDADKVILGRGAQIANERVVIDSSGLFDLNNWAEAIGSLSGNGRVDLGSGILTTGADGTSTTYGGLIQGSGILRKSGGGTFTLADNNSYSGDTEIFAGTLRVNGSQSASDVKVKTGGRLSGIGTVGAVESEGAVAPGASAGQLTAGTTVLGTGSVFELELNSYILPGYDQLDVNGLLKLGNPDLDIIWGFVPAVGDAFLVIDNDGADAISGTFDGLAEGASVVAGNVTLQITYQGGDGNDVELVSTAVDPLEDLMITSVSPDGGNIDLEWEGGVPPFVVEKKTALTNTPWTVVTSPTRDFTGSVPADTTNGFYRVTGGN